MIFWTKKEEQIVKDNIKLDIPSIEELLFKAGFSRSYDSVRKKVKRILKNNQANDFMEQQVEENIAPASEFTEEQKEVIDTYVSLLKDNNSPPSSLELEEAGITRSMIRHRWGNITKLEKAVRQLYPELFNEVGVSSLFDHNTHKALRKKINGYKKFIITTAITGHKVDNNFLASLENYADKQNALLLVMVAADPAHQRAHDDELGYLDSSVQHCNLVLEEMALNNNLYLSGIKLSAKQIDPATGLTQIAQQDGSYIFASPRQRLKFVPVPMHKHPPAIMGTGAVTKPKYNTDMYMSRRTGYMAERTHKMGAIVVEIRSDEIFHFRQVQADENGSFVDWGIQYHSDGSIAPMEVAALVCGDLHAGKVAEEVTNARTELCDELKPNRIVLHDVFDGTSISHHVEGKTITKARMEALYPYNNLSTELHNVYEELVHYNSLAKELVIVKSNHDEHLDRYLEDGRFINDPPNYRISLQLAMDLHDELNPIEQHLKEMYDFVHDNIKFLQRDESYIVAGVELGYHGDRGPNGSRGSIKNFATSVRASITGHSHTAEIYNNAWRVGTSTDHLDYCSGPSSWTKTDCLLYENGSMQLVNYIDGEYKL